MPTPLVKRSSVPDYVLPTTTQGAPVTTARTKIGLLGDEPSPQRLLEVLRALRRGNFDVGLPLGYSGVDAEIAEELNNVIELQRGLTRELKRVRSLVGKDGKLGQRASLPDARGSWAACVESVNELIGDLVRPTTDVARVIGAVADGDLSEKVALEVDGKKLKGEFLRTAKLVNSMVEQLSTFAVEVTRVAREVGTEGKLGGQARVRGLAGTWKDLTDGVNVMAFNLTAQVRNIAEVTTAVAKGDLSRKITVDVRGEMLELRNTINTMLDQLNAFSSEVTRVAREVGTEGKLGGQARVPGVSGTWGDLTDSVNSMASNLTAQVRNIAEVTTAVAKGDLSKKITAVVHGEMLELKNTINTMMDQLNAFSSEVTRVAREVGTEGKLGGQAKVSGAAGTWRDLTDNVNELAANLTTQVRAIGDVATAVTKGDLTRYVAVQASGEVAALKDNINEMIRNLRETTQKTTEQDWLKTHLARFSRMLQGQRDLMTVARQILSELAPLVSAEHGVIYLAEQEPAGETRLKLLASYAASDRVVSEFRLGEGLVGQCALDRQKIAIQELPEGHVAIRSGLGTSMPSSLVILPVLFEGEVNAVIELALSGRPSATHHAFLDQLTESIGIVINTIAASMTTEALLTQSQSLTQELQTQQEELRTTNERLERQAATLRESEERLTLQQEALRSTNEQLEEKAKLLELKNGEIEYAKLDIEEKAEQLALTSRYKSEFLANMSHELRTPLNSLLILSKMLSDNVDDNLTAKQVEFAQTIHASGADLLALINDILDLSKIESGTIGVELADVSLDELCGHVQQSFRHVADDKGLDFVIEIDPALDRTLTTDAKRLKQVLKNLLSNAFKFTERGRVTMSVKPASSGWSRDQQALNRADAVIAFSVIDTGMGIAENKQRIIFEAFQQVDGTTSRRYGGTGLGLSISRELAKLLGGELRLVSTVGAGSAFTLYLPVAHASGVREAPAAASAALAAADPGPRLASDGARTDPGQRALHLLVMAEAPSPPVQALVLAAEQSGYRVTRARDGQAISALLGKHPTAAAVLDLEQSGLEGWIALDRLKRDPETWHVPVAVRCPAPEQRRARCMGAVSALGDLPSTAELARSLAAFERFAAARRRRVLVVGTDPRGEVVNLLGNDAVDVQLIATTAQALVEPSLDAFDCVVLLLDAPDDSRLAVLRSLKAYEEPPPIVIYSERPLTWSEESALGRHGKTLLIKQARTLGQLLHEAMLSAHPPPGSLNPGQRSLLGPSAQRVELAGVRVLVIDDDVRNIFAMASALERHGAAVAYADNGRDGLDKLAHTPEIQAVLVDIMMPDMDGYEVMRRIRESSKSLPVIAVTAKAMPTDREKCIRAGASHYVAKPVSIPELVSALKVSVAS
jgi:signal transduction histidine kinase/CheY-like chemotaxis protein/HAMP domain-containing protein